MKFTYLSLLFLFALAFSACDVDQTREGELPEVDIDLEEGQAPAYDVDWADIDVRTRTETVEVPKIKVVTETEQVEVPYIDMDWPDDMGESAERTLVVEADVMRDATLEIQEVYATGERLIVLASLAIEGSDALEDETMRVSDQVVVNAPDMDVRYYIIGDRPEGGFNNRYNYISSRDQISNLMQNGRAIYQRENS